MQYWMISRQLESLNSHLSDENFHQVYWEIIRCKSSHYLFSCYSLQLNLSSGHCLLWAAGVAHGDISFNNLMYNPETRKDILNDFDLATVMQPGTEYPPQTGCRRTGTKAFMALELLLADGVNGVTLRHYRHELESFAWVLLYAAIKNRSKQQGLDSFHQTLDKSTYDEIFLSKTGVLGNLSRLGEYTDFDCLYAQPLLDTLKLWAELLINSNPKPEEVFGNKRKKIKEIILSESLLITLALKAWPDHQEEDSSWIDAKVNA
jgi:serine/threonine protein kinase